MLLKYSGQKNELAKTILAV